MTLPAAPSNRIVFIDVDGTILEHGSVIAPTTVTAIRAARRRGHLVYLCTGRVGGDIHPDVRRIGFDGAITVGGAFGVSGDEQVIAHPMPAAQAQRIAAYFDEHDIHYFLETDTAVHASPGVVEKLTAHWRQLRVKHAQEFERLGLSADTDAATADRTFATIADIAWDEVAKAVFISDAPDAVTRAQADLGDTFHVIPGSMPLPGGSNGEISMLGVTKGAAIIEMLAHLGRSADDAIGIGDSWNDVEMFEVCGTAVAMGNADPALQRHADLVTTGVLDDGVHNAFVTLGLI